MYWWKGFLLDFKPFLRSNLTHHGRHSIRNAKVNILVSSPHVKISSRSSRYFCYVHTFQKYSKLRVRKQEGKAGSERTFRLARGKTKFGNEVTKAAELYLLESL